MQTFALKMKELLGLLLVLLSLCTVQAQQCVNIERILVDACTLGVGCQGAGDATCNCEGMNEMFSFRVGNNPLNVDDLTIIWPNNPFLGICQNAQTAANVEELNAGVEACGELVEPEDGVLPAGANVLVVTSENMCTEANSFAGLNETVYILFQCAGNFQGHFANHGTGLRTLTISFGAGCFDSATYDRSLLVNQQGNAGAEDGATVDFTAGGAPVYYNDGCNAPVEIETFSAGPNTSGCAGTEILLSGIADGDYTNLQWLGGDGDYSNPTEAVTLYTPAPDESGNVTLTFTAESCEGEVSDEVIVTVLPQPVATIIPDENTVICDGDPLELTLVGEDSGAWSTGESGSSITVTEAGIYTVAVQNLCGEAEASVEVSVSPLPEINLLPEGEFTLCNNEAIELTVSGVGDITWSDGSQAEQFTVTTAGDYHVTATNDCGSVTEEFSVSDGGVAPTANISISGEDSLCPGEETTLTGEGQGDYLWSTGESDSEISVPAGTYTLTVSNACGSADDEVNIVLLPSPEFEINGAPEAIICDDEVLVLEVESDAAPVWFDGTVGYSTIVTEPGTYEASLTTVCGTFSTAITVIPSAVNADFTHSELTEGAPLEVNFINTSQGAIAYEWWVNGNMVSQVTNLERMFSYPDLYEVLLVAIDAGGCIDTTTKVLDIQLVDNQFFVPNAFTPDYDGVNDVFRVYGPEVEDFKLEIYNRWGELVYETTDQHDVWMGEVNGGEYFVQAEVFTWVLTYEGQKRRERLTGHVSVLR